MGRPDDIDLDRRSSMVGATAAALAAMPSAVGAKTTGTQAPGSDAPVMAKVAFNRLACRVRDLDATTTALRARDIDFLIKEPQVFGPGIRCIVTTDPDRVSDRSSQEGGVPMSTAGSHAPLGARGLRLLAVSGAAAVVALGAALFPAPPAAAHHGWAGFNTDNLVYIAGTVSSNGVWGNPHSQFEVTLASKLPAKTPNLAIPEQLRDPEDSVRVNAARSYKGSHKKLEVIIAPPAWSGGWGLGRALKIGEHVKAVGYINRANDGVFRPVVFWYGDDDTPVNQVLGNTLPVRAPLPK